MFDLPKRRMTFQVSLGVMYISLNRYVSFLGHLHPFGEILSASSLLPVNLDHPVVYEHGIVLWANYSKIVRVLLERLV